MKLSIAFLLNMLVLQSANEVKFSYKGTRYIFNLPAGNHTIKETQYTEGVYRAYTFDNGAEVLLHVGGDVVKPILTEQIYFVQQQKDSAGIAIRRGYNQNDKLLWEERTFEKGDVTLLFANVPKDDYDKFKNSINSLRWN